MTAGNYSDPTPPRVAPFSKEWWQLWWDEADSFFILEEEIQTRPGLTNPFVALPLQPKYSYPKRRA